MARRAGQPEWLAALGRHGITPLQNEARRFGQGFWLAGLDSQLAFRRGGGADDLPGTLARITDAAPVILLAHEPDIFATLPERVALTLDVAGLGTRALSYLVDLFILFLFWVVVVLGISVAKEAMDPEDPSVLEDLISAAFKDASAKVDESMGKITGGLTGGLNIPGLGL